MTTTTNGKPNPDELALAKVKAPGKISEAEYAKDIRLRKAKATYVGDMLRLDTRLSALSGGRIDAEQLIAIAFKAIHANPKIAECSAESLMIACRDAAELGLLPSSVQGLAHFVPYWNGKKGVSEAKLIPDYKGLAFLARESGSVLALSAGVIYRGQDYKIREGLEDVLEVSPLPPGFRQVDPEIIYAWAAAKLTAESTPRGYVTQWLYLTRAEVDKIRSSSRAKDDGPWVNWFPEMAKKSAVKRLAKLLPRRGLFGKAIEREDEAEAGEDEEIELNPPPKVSRTAEAEARLAIAAEASAQNLGDVASAETVPEPPADVRLPDVPKKERKMKLEDQTK